MAALPDAESSGIVSSVLKTVQIGGVVVRGRVKPLEAGHTTEGVFGVDDQVTQRESPHPLISDTLSGHSTFQKIGISSLSRM